MSWEPVIGLEIHAHLNTRSKLFSSAPNRFGDAPNTNISVTCTGQPGSLPILNREAIRKAVQFGLAVNAKINKISRFERKSYFYPDLPRNFQITQFEKPLLSGGSVQAEINGKEKLISIHHAHLEDDAGTLKHYPSFTGVDYNRAGAPLIEIVSEPCMESAKEAWAFAFAIRTILIYLNASECNMEEGTFRIDANVSVRKQGEISHRPKVEIKNINSFSFMGMAIDKEIERQIRLYESSPNEPYDEVVPSSTCRWDHEKREIVVMRKKKSVDDYRYFPEPDLAPIVLTDEYIDWVSHTLPELPKERRRRYGAELGLSDQIISNLIHHKPLSDYFDEALKTTTNPRLLANWICGEFAERALSIPPAYMSKLVRMIEEGKITGRIAKNLAEEMIRTPKTDPEILFQNNSDFHPLDSEKEIEPIIDLVLSNHPQTILDFKAGKEKAFDFLVGQVMELTHGKADPRIVNDLLRKKLNKIDS